MSTHQMAARPDATAMPCACSALRMTSRAVSRFHEACLAPTGTTTTQYSILRYIQGMGPTPLRVLADALTLERTSLYRAIGPLKRDGLAEVRTDPDDARVKRAHLTRKGAGQIRRVTPYWRRAQESFVATIGASEWTAAAKHLEELRDRVAQMDHVSS